ncbi:transmembrane protein, putative (macronuclear) [Tetrahymena thermophila SB210]|uniref:Transmembrane protein, putative n=1 Tax=Tetrahymena thermophila (strain SB210) TaxID=312017 RepID=Q23FE0_TETTS|nr:transmembrane protein, putative [Tetrahymena thermophila SB210]EAR95213.1 transmembrane protein, putative [Tetrahymena thermophila SB210]|eukprot:XP_001015458.1 transmembrane protein, putative [Tetrahymena thermophila SB210]
MHRYTSQQADRRSTQKEDEEDSFIKSFIQDLKSGKSLKKLGIVIVLYLIVVKTLLILIPTEYIIMIGDSKKYRIAEFILLLLIFYLCGTQILVYFKKKRPTQSKFVANRQSKEEYIRQRIRTTENELDKLKKSKEFQKWQQSANNRENSSFKESVLDKEDEIVFSDEDY